MLRLASIRVTRLKWPKFPNYWDSKKFISQSENEDIFDCEIIKFSEILISLGTMAPARAPWKEDS